MVSRGADRTHYVAYVAGSLTVLHLLAVLGLAYLWLSTDWRARECFDGTERACDEPAREAGLSAVQAGGWLLGVIAVVTAVGAFVLALRVRRVAQLARVLLLCATSAIVAQALWWSLA